MVTYSVVSTNLTTYDDRFGTYQMGTVTLRVTVPAGYYISKYVGHSSFTRKPGSEVTYPTEATTWDGFRAEDPKRSGTFDLTVKVPAWASDVGAAISWEFETSPIVMDIVVGNSNTYYGDFEYSVTYNGETWNLDADYYWYWNQIPYGAIIHATHIRSANPQKRFTGWYVQGNKNAEGEPFEGVVVNANGKSVEIICTPIFYNENSIFIVNQGYKTATGLILHGKLGMILHGANGTILTDD